MKPEAQFSWFKILSFFGAGIAFFLGFVCLSFGIGEIAVGDTLPGVFSCYGGVVSLGLSVIIFLHYEKKRLADK